MDGRLLVTASAATLALSAISACGTQTASPGGPDTMRSVPGTSAATPTGRTAPGTAASGPSATLAPGDGCIERDAHGDPVWHADTTGAGNRAMKEQDALNADPLKPVAGSAICSDGRRILIASSTFHSTRVRPNGDIEVPLPRPLYQLEARQTAILERFHANSVSFDITRGGYVVGGQWNPMPADTVMDGLPVHFERRGPATADAGTSSGAPGR